MKNIPINYLSSYLYCPLKFYIEEVIKIKKIDPKITIKGIIKHKIFEEIAKNEKEIILKIKFNDSKKDIMLKYKQYCLSFLRKTLIEFKRELELLDISPMTILIESKDLFELESNYRSEIIYNIVTKNQCGGNDLWLKLSPKLNAEKNIISQKYGLHGRIDRIEIYENKVIPVEIKNSNTSTLFDSQKIQLGAYILLCKDLFNKETKYGYVHFLKDNSKKLVVMNEFLKDEILELRNKIINILENKNVEDLFKIKVSSKKCNMCKYKNKCDELKNKHK